MSLDRSDPADIGVLCDAPHGCLEHIDTHKSDVFEALQVAKAAGWTGVRESPSMWRHLCPDCSLAATQVGFEAMQAVAAKPTYTLQEIGR